MNKLFYLVSYLIALCFMQGGIFAQSIFHPIAKESITFGPKCIEAPAHFNAYDVSHTTLKKAIRQAIDKGSVIKLPLPDGSFGSFTVSDYAAAAPGFYQKFPEILTFSLTQIDGPYKGLGDLTSKGFHSSLYGDNNLYYIDPTHLDQSMRKYVAYNVKDYQRKDAPSFACEITKELLSNAPDAPPIESSLNPSVGAKAKSSKNDVPLRTYRFATVTTSEYSQFHGNTKRSVAEAVANLVVRVNEILRREFSIQLQIIEGVDTLFFFDRNNDGLTNGNTSALITEGNTILFNILDFDAFDVGHTLCTNAGGLAQVASVCGTTKGRGVSCSFNPIGDSYYVSIVCHELGHMFGSRHSFNFCRGQNESLTTGYEPGSGSTIMAYAGLCGSNNTQTFTDPYYNIGSLESILAFMHDGNGKNCAEEEPTGNTAPIITLPYTDGFYIPISTPFELHASAVDDTHDDLWYCWEQHNSAIQNCDPGSPMSTCPSFRSLPPTRDSFRIFPEISDIVTGNMDRWEVLPTYSRSMEFSCAVRDWDPDGGRLAWEFVEFDATEDAGPFEVHPISGTFEVGEPLSISWDVANTDREPVNCQFVEIYLSSDGGFTYPHLLATDVPNIGQVILPTPNIPSADTRIKVKAKDNIFFNINNANFRIEAPDNPTFVAQLGSFYNRVCEPHPITLTIETESILAYTGSVRLSDILGLPTDASYTVTPETVQAGDNMSIEIEFPVGNEEESYPLELLLVGDNGDTIVVAALADYVSNDFSDIAPITPGFNEQNVSQGASFSWRGSADAESYTLQIAVAPTFAESEIIYEAVGVADTVHQPNEILDRNSILYWRVIPTNDCGESIIPSIFAFRTEAASCQRYTSEDVPHIIRTTGSARVTSELLVEESGIISDVNVLNLRGSHGYIGELIAELESPSGTKVKLFDEDCFNTTDFRITLDDEASSSISCPINDGQTNRPRGQLSDFNGENTQGSWKIQLSDNTAGTGGELLGWGLELCGSITISPPTLVTDTLYVDKNESRFLTPQQLSASKGSFGASDFEYTVINPPKYGSITYGSVTLTTGSRFAQGAIDAYHLIYTQNGSDELVDYMTFTMVDAEGGWIGIDTLYIVVDPILQDQTAEAIALDVFPNPATHSFSIRVPEELQSGTIQLRNLQGKVLRQQPLNGQLIYQMSTENFPPGMYFVDLQSEKGREVRQLVIQ